MIYTKTLYNELWAGNLPLSLFEVPNALKRRRTKGKNHINKRPNGRSIEQHPAEVANRVVPGHWKADTVVGLRTEFGAQFSKVFKTITTDNGPEFEDFAAVE